MFVVPVQGSLSDRTTWDPVDQIHGLLPDLLERDDLDRLPWDDALDACAALEVFEYCHPPPCVTT